MEEKSISSDLIRGHIDTIILHTILESEKNAQQITDNVSEKSNNEYQINQATLYSSLKRLETLKYLTSFWKDSDDGRRKFFKITESGKFFVEQNLSNWSYSRAIIDKLMDVKPDFSPVSTPILKVIEDKKQEQYQENQNIRKVDNIEENVHFDNKSIEDEDKEINFRNILGGLLKTSNLVESSSIEKTENKIELKSIEKTEKIEEKTDFNKLISNSDVISSKKSNYGNIDFGDLSIKASQEGYKIRISNKYSAIKEGDVFINKLKFFSSFLVFLLSIIELSYVYVNHKEFYSTMTFVLATIFLLIFPIIRLVKYINKPNFTVLRIKNADSILTSAIVVFNLILIDFALIFILNVDLKNAYNVYTYILAPIALFIDGLLYFIFKYCFSKLKTFQTHKGKK